MSHLEVTLLIGGFFLAISLAVAALLAIHDGVEWLVTRRTTRRQP